MFVPVIVAIEADRQDRPLARSRELAQDRWWRIAIVFLTLSVLDLAANYLLLARMANVDTARILFAFAQSVLAMAGQLATIATLLMYLGITQPAQKKPTQKKTAKL
jgi:hypothetical protein